MAAAGGDAAASLSVDVHMRPSVSIKVESGIKVESASASAIAASSVADSVAPAGTAAAGNAADSVAAAGGAAASSAAASVASAGSAAPSTFVDVGMRPSVAIKVESGVRAAAAAGGIDDGWYMTGNTGGTAEDFARRRRFRELVASLSRQRSRQLR